MIEQENSLTGTTADSSTATAESRNCSAAPEKRSCSERGSAMRSLFGDDSSTTADSKASTAPCSETKAAGWRTCGKTKGGLVILEREDPRIAFHQRENPKLSILAIKLALAADVRGPSDSTAEWHGRNAERFQAVLDSQNS